MNLALRPVLPGSIAPLPSPAKGFRRGAAAEASHLPLGLDSSSCVGVPDPEVLMATYQGGVGWGGVGWVEEENGQQSIFDRDLLHSLHSHKSPLGSCLCEVPAR